MSDSVDCHPRPLAPPTPRDVIDTFDTSGIVHVTEGLDAAACATVAEQLAAAATLAATQAGTRNLLAQPWARALAAQLARHPVLAGLLPPDAVPLQVIAFEKSMSRNWLVALHQDLGVPAGARWDDPRWTGWSTKEGGLHVHAPTDVLEQLVALRLHLDPCGADDGPLRVVPGSHRHGRLDAEAAAALRRTSDEWLCVAGVGSVWAMRPLLLHASSKATGTSRRRVLHLLYAPRAVHALLRLPADA